MLHMAAESGSVELVTVLINTPSVDVNMLTYSGLTAYDMASEHPNVLVILAKRMPTDFSQRPDSSASEDEMVCIDQQ